MPGQFLLLLLFLSSFFTAAVLGVVTVVVRLVIVIITMDHVVVVAAVVAVHGAAVTFVVFGHVAVFFCFNNSKSARHENALTHFKDLIREAFKAKMK
jgi:hypothetical protein